MYDELRRLCDSHGLFLRREVIALGYSDPDIHRALRAGIIHRARHGSYVFRHEWDAMSQRDRHALRAWAVHRTARTALAFSHVTAAVLHGAPAWEFPFDDVHVTRRDRRGGRKEAGVAQHRGLLLPADLVAGDGFDMTTATRTALDLTTILDVEHCLPVFDHFLHSRATTKSALQAGALRMRSWANTLTTDLVIRLANPRCESVGESRTSYMLWRGGVVAPVTAYDIIDETGRVFARVDFAWPELGVFLEFDGKEKYLKHRREGESIVDAVRREKRREERICRITGWRCIRITWADLLHPERTVALINSVLAGGPVHQ